MSAGGLAGEVHGNGPDILLLHGVGLDRRMWDRVWPELARTHRVHLVDLPGHGGSGPVRRGSTLADIAQRVADAMPAPGHVVGFSLGGLVAQELALDHPELVTRLSLVSTVADRTADQRRAVLARLQAATDDFEASARASVDRWFSAAWHEREPDLADEVLKVLLSNDRESYLACYEVFARADEELWPRLAQISAPTVVVTGEDDGGSTPAMTRALAAAVPDARAVVVPNTRHLLPLERPQELLEVLLRQG
ncbi:Pimeloyl-ACP methyl ester carboxylesterase [Quadrisphaera granulorum]|uniref:Pimeloyl-ACP methyl ester carboxylesterase n=1 Tax=Quadrisphaera granulorum TaxID=317664 RepID=A0A316A9G7_9ACTN|nr:alpha/beta fold hydrolase [Quadrisphaera granulorum]PWJ54331.1 pimeloyl-ACP methyl ester carboxylesterase [Quadrisphaera granulorum]SZE96103.1 Pimeloyl-ACP methyl ester carboxylesterase [Quadrisphaera granulorum]